MLTMIQIALFFLTVTPPGLVDDRAKANDPIGDLPVQEDWQPDQGNPCLSFGEQRTLASWNDPCVLAVDGRYVMYVTTSMLTPGQPPVLPFRAVSDDGRRWTLEPKTPLLSRGQDPSDFDLQSVETPSVVFFKDRYHLYYTGVRKGLAGPMAIGHATSKDGIHWEKDLNNPVLLPTGHPEDFNGFQVDEPGAVVRNGEVYLYFASVGLRPGGHPPARRVIALARSTDASHFGASKVVLEQSALFPAKLGFDGYSAPAAAIHEGRVHLFYDVGHFDQDANRKWSQVALHHAVSNDGETGWTQDAEALFTTRSFDWTSLEIRSPSPLYRGDVLELWFAGNAKIEEFLPEVKRTGRTRKFGIGRATRRLGSVDASKR